MADLTAKLPTEMDSAQRFVQPAAPAPSIWESLANFGSQAADTIGKVERTLTANQGAKRAAADEAARNSAVRAGVNFLSDASVGNPATQPPAAPATPQQQAAQTQGQQAGQQITALNTAASQGKLDPSMAQAKALAITRQAIAANPGHEFVVYQALKDMGITNMITQNYANAETAIESDQSAQLARQHDLEMKAVTKYGYSNYDQMSPPDKAKTLATVSTLEMQESALDAQTKAADLVLKQAQLTNDQKNQLQKTQSQGLLGTASSNLQAQFGNVTKVMINMLGDPTLANDPARMEKLQSHLMSVAIPSMDSYYAQQRAKLAGTMTSDDLSQLDKAYDMSKQSLIGMISGPQSIVEQNKRILSDIDSNYGIDFAKSAPMLNRVKQLIGPQAMGVLLSPQLLGNPALKDMISNELNNVIRDPSRTASFSDLVKNLAGQADLSSFNPEQIRAMAPAKLAFMNQGAKDVTTTNGTDKDAHRVFVNNVRDTAGIAADVVPQWGFGNVLGQAKVLNQSGVTNSLFGTTVNRLEREDAIKSWIPATTRTYVTLSTMDSGDKYYSAKLDPHTLTWQAVWNGKMMPAAPGGIGDYSSIPAGQLVKMGINPNNQVKPQPTAAVREQVSALNSSLNNLSVSAAKGWDFDGKAVPYSEARRFFATGEVPGSLAPKATGKTAKTPEQNVDDAISHLVDLANQPNSSTSVTQKGGANHALAPAFENKGAMDAYYAGPGKSAAENYSKFAPVVAEAANKHGIPLGVAMNLVHTESKFNPGANSGQAAGLGQIAYKEAARRGWTSPDKMSAEENIDKAFTMLAENYKATGNWKDAAAMYLTGRSLSAAGNAHDKNGTTAPVYAAAVVPSSNWADTNMPLGVSTPYGVRY